MKLYHNPRCGKSRAVKNYLEENKIPHDTVLYLNDGITSKEISLLIDGLKEPLKNIVRTKEKVFKEKHADVQFTKDAVLKMIVEDPILLERPILYKNNKTVIGRPFENILELI